MENDLLITTTNNIENAAIEKYIDLISTNVVVGTNIFSDFGASLSDIFGGFSETYQNKLQLIYKSAIENLQLKASKIGANAIIGFKIDFDEISGKGKSMFMISAIGTAVQVNFLNNNQAVKSNENSIVSNDKLNKEIIKREIISKAENDKLYHREEWVYLLNNPIIEIADKILELIFGLNIVSETENNVANYFKIIRIDIAENILYSKLSYDLEEYKIDAVLNIIEKNKLFAPSRILDMLEKDKLDLAIKCLLFEKDFYSEEDFQQMQLLLSKLNNLPDTGKIEKIKGFGRGVKEKYICMNGHKNNSEIEYCREENCGVNIKGLTRKQSENINSYINVVNALESLIR